MKYSAATLIRQALRGQRKWPPIVAPAQLKKNYDVIIIGAGGHGPASAHYLADPRLDQAVSHFLEGERDQAEGAIDWYRERSALKPDSLRPLRPSGKS